MKTEQHTTDARALIEKLDANEIARRLADLREEREALLVLLRAARAHGRSRSNIRGK
jgi:hypothetical protein